MQEAWVASTIVWIAAHPAAAGGLIFLIALIDSLVVIGIAVPALPLLFAVGALIGLGHVDGPYAIACAASGAFAGDFLSFWAGGRWGAHSLQRWPFNRYPGLLQRAESLFRRHGTKSIVIARFVGAVRPFVPAIAGMLHMPLRAYAPASALAAVAWAVAFLGPGWVLGASYDAVAAVADRLAAVLLAVLALVALALSIVHYIWVWFDGHANSLLQRALRWIRAHPRLGRHAAALVDPNRPESASLAILAVCLLVIGWALAAVISIVSMRGEPLLIDRSVHELMLTLRNPLADRLMAGIASLGDAQVLAPAVALAMAWLLWRRRWIAVAHWLAALAFGLVLTLLLRTVSHIPEPPLMHGAFSFPSVTVTMAAIVLGFFAVLIARELPGRSRVWPYLLAGVLVMLIGFARIYLGMHWLSDVVGGSLLGMTWLLALGIAYRRHVARSFWMKPLASIFYVAIAVSSLWYVPQAVDPLLAKLRAPPPRLTLAVDAWWRSEWQQLPAIRSGLDTRNRWPLGLQFAGQLDDLQREMLTRGWSLQPTASWTDTLGLLDEERSPASQPVLPATLNAAAETILLRRPVANGWIEVLRLWPAPARLADQTPLWVGAAQSLQFSRPLSALGLWLPVADDGAAQRQVLRSLGDLQSCVGVHPVSGREVLRIRSSAPSASMACPSIGPD